MKTLCEAFAMALACAALTSVAGAQDRSLDHSRYISTYAPVQGFNHVVGQKRFVGYFLTRTQGCDVTVIVADADDERLDIAPRRHEVLIPAADRAEFPADSRQVLAIGCTVDADFIKVVPLVAPEPIISSRR